MSEIKLHAVKFTGKIITPMRLPYFAVHDTNKKGYREQREEYKKIHSSIRDKTSHIYRFSYFLVCSDYFWFTNIWADD